MCDNHHSTYYIKGGDFYLQVGLTIILILTKTNAEIVSTQAEHTLFRVHSHFFVRESLRFREMAGESNSGRPRLGFAVETPIKLENVKAEELAAFVWVFYNP